MTTAAYVRISGDKQDTQRQKDSVAKWDISIWFEDSEGKNPRDQAAKRKGFQQMLKAVQAGLISRIVVDRQDRFGVKDAYEWGKFIDLLRSHDCELIDASGKVLSDDDDATILTGTLGAITSRREQKEKAHRNLTGKLPRARAGEYQGGYAPYGLDVCCFNGKEKWRVVYTGHFERQKVWPDGKREQFDGKGNFPAKETTDTLRYRPSIERERIKTVKQIFEWFTTESISCGQIATRLNAMGISGVFGPWNKQKVKALLKNPVYIGLPTWNKRGGSRFSEFVGGQIREVKKVKLGRPRQASDFVQPDKQEFPPIVSVEVFEKAQARLTPQKRKGRAPNTSMLWLRPFVVCGKCGKTMHATRGGAGQRIWPSYFCGTYNTYGKDNPTGCRCHRVRHAVIEKIVLRYLQETQPKIKQLIKSVKSGEIDSMLKGDELNSLRSAYHGVACDILSFLDQHKGRKFKRLLDDSRSLVEAYGVVYEHILPELTQAIERREDQLDRMLDDYRGLPDSMRERANQRMKLVSDEVSRLTRQAKDLRVPLANLEEQIRERGTAIDKALAAVRKDSEGRRKTEALSGVIDRIVCHFRYTDKKSFLERVEIIAADGSSYSACSPGQG